MSAIQQTREYVQQLFTEMKSTDEVSETVLIRDGVYCGHRFTCERFSAVWFYEENELKIYDLNRNLVRVEYLGEQQQEYRRAA